jgi:hydroxylaminobenzene mutase
MSTQPLAARRSFRLLQLGILLFLLGLLVGFAVPALANPRMGLASHLEGIMNGLFLVVLGLVWPRLTLPGKASTALFWLALYSTFANWAATLLAAFWGAGSSMPLAAGAHRGSATQELIIDALLISLALGMVSVCALTLFGLRAGASRPATDVGTG